MEAHQSKDATLSTAGFCETFRTTFTTSGAASTIAAIRSVTLVEIGRMRIIAASRRKFAGEGL